MSTRPPRVLLAALAVAALLAGCSDSDGTASPATTSPAAAPSSALEPTGTPTAEPTVAQQEAAAEAAADPAAAADPQQAALATALRATDLPAGWTVQANPVPDGDLGSSLAGICDYPFTSETLRTMKYSVTGIDPTGSPSVVAEAIAYDSPDSGMLALTELAAAFQNCPPEDYTFLPTPAPDGLAPVNFRVRYQLTGGAEQIVIAQQRGALLTVLLAGDEATALTTGAAIAVRMAALPAASVGV